MPGQLISRLRPIRVAAGLKQIDLAQKLGWADHTHVSNVERGIRGTDPETIEKWIEACDHDIFIVPRWQQPQATEVAGVLASLSAADQALLVRVARLLPRLGASRDRFMHDVDYLERQLLGGKGGSR